MGLGSDSTYLLAVDLGKLFHGCFHLSDGHNLSLKELL